MIGLIAYTLCISIYSAFQHRHYIALLDEVIELRAEIVKTAGYAETYRLAIAGVDRRNKSE